MFTLLRKLKCSTYLKRKKKMPLTRFVFSQVLSTKTLFSTKKHSSMNLAVLYGKYNEILTLFHSLVMEYADNGDVF